MSSSQTGRTHVSSCSIVGLRNSGAVSRTKSFQNCPALWSAAAGGARSTRSSSKPSGSSRPFQDASAANTTRWPRRRRTSPIPMQLLVGPYALSGMNKIVSGRSLIAGSQRSARIRSHIQPGQTARASHELGPDGSPLEPALERFQQTFDRIAGVPGVRLHNLAWRSSYRVNVRMVDQLRVGRVFLAGDAAHVHPIAGGLGMNSGIQDAYNLGWKLGLVLTGKAGPGLLDTYEEERLPIASWLLDITSDRLTVVLDAIR